MTGLSVLLLLAQVPFRLADLDPSPASQQAAVPNGFVQAGPVAFFYATDSNNGFELWVTDGTDAGTRMVRDIAPGSASIDREPILALDAGVVAFVEDGDLFISDATAAGTTERCCATREVDSAGVIPNGRILVGVRDPFGSGRWLSVVDSIPEGASQLASVNVTLFLGAVGNRMLLTGRDPVSLSPALWSTDGTPAGTHNLLALSNVTSFTRLAVVGGTGYLVAFVGGQLQVVRTDGTPAGTQVLGRPASGTITDAVVAAGPLACFPGSFPGAGAEVLAWDPALNAFKVLADVNPGTSGSAAADFVSFGSGVLFAAIAGGLGDEPFFADGFDGGFVRLADISPGSGSSSPSSFTPNGGRALFKVSGSQPLWVTDGTPAGTGPVPGVSSAAAYTELAPFAGGWLFSRTQASISDPWFTDGTSARPVQTISLRGTASSNPFAFTAQALTVPFIAVTNPAGYELYRFDALDGGLLPSVELNPGPASGVGLVLGQLGGRLIVNAEDVSGGLELFSVGPTPGDVTLVKDIRAGLSSSDPFGGVTAGSVVYFHARTAAEGYELWRTDGTNPGTTLVQDLYPGSATSLPDPSATDAPPVALPDGGLILNAESPAGLFLWSVTATGGYTRLHDDYATRLLRAGDRAYADLCSIGSGCELWATDGTPAGTVLWAETLAGSGSGSPRHFAALGDQLMFVANDEDGGVSLFVTTDAGFNAVAPVSVYAIDLAPGAGGVLFAESTTETGREPWFTDGTGKRLVRDIIPGPESSEPSGFTVAGRRTFFVASDREHGRELWVTDGTGAGTRMFADLAPGPSSSSPYALFSAYGWLFFGAADNDEDTEPYAVPLTEGPPAITTQVTGQTGGDGGWYVTDVGVTFRVSDPDVPILTSSGCGTSRMEFDGGFIGATVVTQDGPDTVLPCRARSSGGESSVSVSVRRDATAPRISCPPTVMARATGVTGAVVSFATPVAVDQIDPAPAVTLSHASGSTFALGRTVVTATATDHVGHASECTFSVEVRDPQPPVLTCPMDQQVAFGTAVTYAATATDDIDPMPMLTFSAPSGTVFPPGRSGVSVTAIDAAGNLASCAFFVTVDAPVDGGGGGMVNGSCGCGSSPFGVLAFAVLALLRRRRR